ncbi:MAG: AAA family ATPase [Candidatus Pacearchaeota archaeon]|nr:AAA family ATPase [Candidatus Pacearchaeota archaeon]
MNDEEKLIWKLLDTYGGEHYFVIKEIQEQKKLSIFELQNVADSEYFSRFIPFKNYSNEEIADKIIKVLEKWEPSNENKQIAEGIHRRERELYEDLVAYNEKLKTQKLLQDFNIKILSESIKKGVPKLNYCVEGLIVENSYNLVEAIQKGGKTSLALFLSLCVANGKPFLGRACKKGSILYIDEEMGEQNLLFKITQLAEGNNLRTDNIHFTSFAGVKLQGEKSKEWSRKLKEYILQVKPKMIIFDSAVRMMEGDENQAKDVRQVFDSIKSLKEKCTIVLLAHTPWDGKRVRGSTEWEAQADQIFILKNTGKNFFKIKNRPSRFMCEIDEKYQLAGEVGKPIEVITYGQEVIKETSISKEFAIEIAEWLDKSKIKEFKKGDIMKQFDVPETRWNQAKNILIEDEIIGEIGSKYKGKYSVDYAKLKLYIAEK